MPNYRSLVPGGFFSSNPKDRSLPVSVRTNNPGAVNIAAWVKKYPGFVDASLTTPGNKTVIFEAPEYGVAAWWQLLRRYRPDLEPNFSLRNIVFKYCGRGREKEAVEYLQFVSARTNVHGDQRVGLEDFAAMTVLARAFFHYEAGRASPLSDAQLAYGFDFAQQHSGAPVQPAPAPRSASRASRARAVAPAAAAAAAPTSKRALLANLAESEAGKRLRWTGAASEAEKFLKPFREPMRRLGHIGADPILYNWCAAFVTWCAREVGCTIPDQPTGWNATMALVDSWKFWANQQGYFLAPPAVSQMQAGDVLLYEWFDGDRSLDHIGVFLRPAGKKSVVAAEGNVNNHHGKKCRQHRRPGTAARLTVPQSPLAEECLSSS